MIRLSAFADEISGDLDEQVRVLKSENIHHLDLRGVWGTNVLDLTDRQVEEIARALEAESIGVAAIASPIGKVPIDHPFEEHLLRFERALALARVFQTRFVRVFSFYARARGADGDPAGRREEVLARLHEMTARARAAGVVLLHENEREIYGDTIARCVDLMRSIDDPHFQSVFDPANFIQCRQTPHPDGYQALRRWLRCVHVKDARADGRVTVAGEGEAQWPAIVRSLRRDGFDGFLSLEPHLSEAGRFRGFSGPDLFRHASRTFRLLLSAG